MSEQLSLFGNEYAPSPNKKEKKSKSIGKTSNSQAKSLKDQNIEVDLECTIHYARKTFDITDFITEIPDSGKVSLKQLREKMEMSFFELTEQRTVWDYDLEKKRLMPYASGTTKGFIWE